MDNTLVSGWAGRAVIRAGRLSFKDRLLGFISLIRPIFFILTPFNAASAAVLSFRGYPSLSKCVLGFLAVAFASCAINVFNDYTDRERDKLIWPGRPIPGGRVKPGEALLVVITSLVAGLSIAWLAFNPVTFSILLAAMALGFLYSVFLRNRMGYLSLPPIVGLIYLGGWAAFSPGTLFTNWLPWYLYFLGIVWQAAHIMVYYPLHIVGEDVTAKFKAPPALFFTPSPRAAIKTGIIFTCLTLAAGLGLFFIARLHLIYLILVLAAGVYALICGLKFYKNITEKRAGVRAFMALSVFRLTISGAILLSVLIAGLSR
jgi:heme o synthase